MSACKKKAAEGNGDAPSIEDDQAIRDATERLAGVYKTTLHTLSTNSCDDSGEMRSDTPWIRVERGIRQANMRYFLCAGGSIEAPECESGVVGLAYEGNYTWRHTETYSNYREVEGDCELRFSESALVRTADREIRVWRRVWEDIVSLDEADCLQDRAEEQTTTCTNNLILEGTWAEP